MLLGAETRPGIPRWECLGECLEMAVLEAQEA